jgi:trk system potassium uptake protein TrkA
MKQFVVIGLGEFGQEVARTLTSEGAEVIAVDSDMAMVETIKNEVAQAVCLDATDSQALKSLELEGIEGAVVAIGENREAAILITAILKELGVTRIVARALGSLHGRILGRVGADQVIYPEMQMAQHVAKRLIASPIFEQVILADNHSLVKIEAHPSFWNKTISEIGIRSQYNLLIIGILQYIPEVKDNGTIMKRTKLLSMPGPKVTIQEGDMLFVVGHDDNIEKLAKLSRRTALKE